MSDDPRNATRHLPTDQVHENRAMIGSQLQLLTKYQRAFKNGSITFPEYHQLLVPLFANN